MLAALLGMLFLLFPDTLLAGRFSESTRRSLRRRVFIGLGILGTLLWFAEPLLHKPQDSTFTTVRWFHAWDTYHYYIGAKYFEELGYKDLYNATAVADAESGYHDPRRQRLIRNLTTNELEPVETVFRHAEQYKNLFTEDRWREFRHDVDYFRGVIERHKMSRSEYKLNVKRE